MLFPSLKIKSWVFLIPILLSLAFGVVPKVRGQEKDPLPSWNPGASKQSILKFVNKISDPDSPDFVPVEQRIAVFDNDGTLWAEKPLYVQLQYALDQVKEMAAKQPEWKHKQPFKAILEGDLRALKASGKKGLLEVLALTHSGMTSQEFKDSVKAWIKKAKHPRFQRPYTELIYQPMLELLNFLRSKGFKTYIVSGGGLEFMRPWAPEVYGIPPEQIIGSSIKTRYEYRQGEPAIVRLQEVDFIDDKAGKPVGIEKFIGRRPIAAFGNSDGDLQMLQWTTAMKKPSLGVIIHHTDAKREWAYDRDSAVGKLDQALKEAKRQAWTVVDMKKDWKVIFPFQQESSP